MAGLGDIAAAPRRLLTRSKSLDVAELLREARRVEPEVSADEYTAARLCASEHGRGTPAELACIVDTELNVAARRGKSLTALLAPGGDYGPQGGARPASTRLNPTLVHLTAARAVIHGELRGIARGADQFFDARTMDALHRKSKAGLTKHIHSCSALGLLLAWSFDLPRCHKNRRCCEDGKPPVANPGSSTKGWVGAIPGVNAYRLMLLRRMPAGPAHTEAFEQARAIILRGTQPDTPIVAAIPWLLAAAAAAAYVRS